MERVGDSDMEERVRCRKWILLAHWDDGRLLILLLSLLFLRSEVNLPPPQVNRPMKAYIVYIKVSIVV